MSLATCPHCKYEFDSEDIWHSAGVTGTTDFPTESDGDTNDTQCLNCKEPLRIELSLDPHWKFLDKDNEEISDWDCRNACS